jgi:transaldolase
MNPLRELTQYGQAVWLDDLHRDLVAGSELKRLIEEDGLSGLTSNPAIFQKAISDGSAYGEDIRQLKDKRLAAEEIFNAIAVHDVQMAADAFRPLYDRTGGEQGYVSLEVSPHFAHHTKPTIEEARRLWWAVARPNIFIKVPATREGLSAIEQLLSEGINVNVTLLFGLRRYGEVANAFIAGVEKRRRSGESIENLRSVASFFLSRIDVMVNPERQIGGTVAGRSGHRLRQGGLPDAQADFRRGSVEPAGGEGRPSSTPVVGQHGDEKPG